MPAAAKRHLETALNLDFGDIAATMRVFFLLIRCMEHHPRSTPNWPFDPPRYLGVKYIITIASASALDTSLQLKSIDTQRNGE